MFLGRFVYGVFGIVIGEWPQGRISGRRRQHNRWYRNNYPDIWSFRRKVI